MNNTFKLVILITAICILPTSLLAKCPKKEGEISWKAVPVISKDGKSDQVGGESFYFDNGQWLAGESSTAKHIVDTGSWLDIKSFAACVDKSPIDNQLSIFLRFSMSGFPGAYKDTDSKKSYLFGTGDLGASGSSPTNFIGSMAFKVVNLDALKESGAAHVFFLLAQFDWQEGEIIQNRQNQTSSDPGPRYWVLMKSNNTISSVEEATAAELTLQTYTYVMDLDDNRDQEEGPENQDQGQDSPNNEEGEDDQQDFSKGVPAVIEVDAGLSSNFTTATGITSSSQVLLQAMTYTGNFLPEQQESILAAGTGSADSTRAKKVKLNKLGKKKKGSKSNKSKTEKKKEKKSSKKKTGKKKGKKKKNKNS